MRQSEKTNGSKDIDPVRSDDEREDKSLTVPLYQPSGSDQVKKLQIFKRLSDEWT